MKPINNVYIIRLFIGISITMLATVLFIPAMIGLVDLIIHVISLLTDPPNEVYGQTEEILLMAAIAPVDVALLIIGIKILKGKKQKLNKTDN